MPGGLLSDICDAERFNRDELEAEFYFNYLQRNTFSFAKTD